MITQRRIIHATSTKDLLTFEQNIPVHFSNVLTPPLVATDSTSIQLRKILLYTKNQVPESFRVSCNLLCTPCQSGSSLGIYISNPRNKSCTILEDNAVFHSVLPGTHHILNIQLHNLDLERLHNDLNITAIVLELIVIDESDE